VKPIHKKCGTEMESRNDMFYYRGRYFPGLVCVKCNALYDDPSDSFHLYVGLPHELSENIEWRKCEQI
jgi:hypothetical protein